MEMRLSVIMRSTKVYALRKGDCRANAQASQQPRKTINKADTPTDTAAHCPESMALSTWQFRSASTDLRLCNRSDELS